MSALPRNALTHLTHLCLAACLLALASCAPRKQAPTVPPPDSFDKPTEPIPQPRPVPRPGFQTLDSIEDTILLDLQNLSSDAERRNARYFIGCDRTNLGEDTAEFEQGIDRGINQLSRERALYKTVAVGPGECIYRIDLDAIGWTRQDWGLLEQADILGFQSKTIRARNIQFLAQTKQPYLYGSSAMITAYEGDAVAARAGQVYYKLMRQDANTVRFLAQEGVDRQAQVNDETALYSGFSQSQIALGKTRMIAVYESREGYCISTYDSKLGGADLFQTPFTIELARAGQINNQQITNKIYQHDAQEHICSLANGLFGLYRLNNAQDNAEVAAPTDIVIQINGARIDPTIRIGDCALCHYKEGAAQPFRDQLRAHVVSNPGFNSNEKRVARIFFDFDQVSARIDELNRNHTQALISLGVTAKEDPLWNVVTRPLREEMNIDQVAALLFLDTATFREKLTGAARSSQVFGNLLTGGTINLATLSGNFDVLIDELSIFEDADL